MGGGRKLGRLLLHGGRGPDGLALDLVEDGGGREGHSGELSLGLAFGKKDGKEGVALGPTPAKNSDCIEPDFMDGFGVNVAPWKGTLARRSLSATV